MMAKYDHGGGCACGLYAECQPDCLHKPDSTHDLCHRLRTMAARPRLPKDEAALMREAAKSLDKAREAEIDARNAAKGAQRAAVERATKLAYSTGYSDGYAHAKADAELPPGWPRRQPEISQ